MHSALVSPGKLIKSLHGAAGYIENAIMNSIFAQIILNVTRKAAQKAGRNSKSKPTLLDISQATAQFKQEIKRLTRDSFWMLLGVFSAAFGLESFLLPNQFIDGGATGISLLLTELSGWPLSLLIVVINIPFVMLGWKVVNWEFAVKTAIAIVGLSIAVHTVPFPVVTHDALLVAIFGGFFLGAGIGFSMRGGAVLDGTEVLAIFLSKWLGTTIGDIIIGINVIIFGVAAYLLSVEVALYAMITYWVASKTLDFIVQGIEEYTGVTIISPLSNKIRLMITQELGRGVTIYKGKGGYGKRGEMAELDIVYTVVTRLEINKLKAELHKIDAEAFVVMSAVKDIKGGIVKKRPLQH